MNELKIEVPAPRKEGTRVVKLTEKKQEKLRSILDELREEMAVVERARKRVREEKISFFTPQQNKKMIEEIKIPPLKLFREEHKKS